MTDSVRCPAVKEYTATLEGFLSSAGGFALEQAYELGRRAAHEGMSLLQFAELHHAALRRLSAAPGANVEEILTRGEQFFSEGLSAFEMILRSHRASARLLGLSDGFSRQNGELSRTRSQLRELLDASGAMVYLRDADGRLLFVNGPFEQLFGVSDARVLGKALHEVVSGPNAHALLEGETAVLQSGVPHTSEKVLQGPDGPRTYRVLDLPLVREAALGPASSFPGSLFSGSQFPPPGPFYAAALGSRNGKAEPQQAGHLQSASDGRGGNGRVSDGSIEGSSMDGLSGASHRAEEPTIYAVCSVATDITSERRAEEALSFARDTSETAHRQLDWLTNALADDLLAPLRSIDGFTQALAEDCGEALDPTSKSHLANVRQSAQRMATLIDSLLAMSQLSRNEMRKDAVDLTELARSVAAQLRQAEPDRRVSVEIQPGLRAQGDSRLFGAVLQNLLGNSWKFTRRREDAQIVVGENSERGTKVYFVKDNGTGFDMAHSGKLFSVFQTLHSRREFAGNGVGLATVQRIVNRHGGRVWAESTLDRGATFYFTIGEHFS
ncbi:MAG: hypothetical protein RL033_5731 [Pseudomonadota bacterium]